MANNVGKRLRGYSEMLFDTRISIVLYTLFSKKY